MRRKYRKKDSTLNKIQENTDRTLRVLERVEQHTAESAKSSRAKMPVIITICELILAIIGLPYVEVGISFVLDNIQSPQVDIISEYTTLPIYKNNQIKVATNFETEGISIRAYLNSIQNGDVVEMRRVDRQNWQATVYFENIGNYKVIVTARMPNGDEVENSIMIKVTPTDDMHYLLLE